MVFNKKQIEISRPIEMKDFTEEDIRDLKLMALTSRDPISNILKHAIENIYVSIITIKYLGKDNKKDIKKIFTLIENIRDIKDNYYEMKEYLFLDYICKDVYKNLLLRYPCLNEEMEEEFKPEYIFDMAYHIANFRKWGKNDEKFISILNGHLIPILLSK